ncbi:MAG: hypothetical protein IEMM0008_1646 [bacterium]|nr:MAG: hypothetical protein IEMM0008_1646 [bacterium]
MKIEIFTRRQFIQRMTHLGRMGLYGAAGFSLLNCTGSVPTIDDIDPPFICKQVDNCKSDLGGSFDYTTGGATVFLVFSAYNKSTEKVTGYNIWYNISDTTIVNEHAAKNRSSVIIQNGTTTVSTAVGGAIPTIPSTLVPGAYTQTTFIGITITGTTPGYFIYVTAYNGTDGEDSDRSNQYVVM